ncbi:hypothetical protein Tco_0196656 [Tanacetum coccineum]
MTYPCHWFSEQVGLAGDLGSTNDILIPLVKIDDPNITIEEYIRLEEEKARRHGKVYNWETATYGKVWYDEHVHDLKSVETEFPAIVFNDALTSEVTLSCETMTSHETSTRDTYKSDITYHQLIPISLHLKMILENVNNNVGELVGLTLNPKAVPIFQNSGQ